MNSFELSNNSKVDNMQKAKVCKTDDIKFLKENSMSMISHDTTMKDVESKCSKKRNKDDTRRENDKQAESLIQSDDENYNPKTLH
jgi:hypothetical protein